MNRFNKEFTTTNIDLFKSQLFEWSQQFEVVSWLDTNNFNNNYSSFDIILAVDEKSSIKLSTNKDAFHLLENYQKKHHDYLFGFLSYDLKNDVENLTSNNFDGLYFPSLYFFQPKKIIFIKNNNIVFSYLVDLKAEIETDYLYINNQPNNSPVKEQLIKEANIKQRISKETYVEKCHHLLQHIHRGDIYEINFCMEFFIENTRINASEIFKKLNAISSPPFACFFRLDNFYICSASPERYLKKMGQKIISQPIKGTSKRGFSEEQDAELKKMLQENIKEQSENIMIVDLVRNDLSKTAVKGSVKVEELCGIYTFKQVHQLISTISSEIPRGTSPIKIIKNTFPMGSMTGAPKIAAMKIIEEIEATKRGLYSGSVGYFTPNGDFDFNVVIRSILHNAETQYTSFSVGSAITALSNPTQEYQECLLKGKAMKQVLTGA